MDNHGTKSRKSPITAKLEEMPLSRLRRSASSHIEFPSSVCVCQFSYVCICVSELAMLKSVGTKHIKDDLNPQYNI